MRPVAKPLDDWLAAVEVIGLRLPFLWQSVWQPSARVQAEVFRMWTEKPMAAFEGMFRMQMQFASECWRLWQVPAQTGGAPRRIAAAGAAPALKRLHANRRRLRMKLWSAA